MAISPSTKKNPPPLFKERGEFSVMHCCPTGCSFFEDESQPRVEGRHPTRVWTVRGEAIAFAEAAQSYSNADGDPDGSYCRVYRSWVSGGGSDCIHTTTPIQKLKGWEPHPAILDSITLGLTAWFSTMSQYGVLPLEQELSAVRATSDAVDRLSAWLKATYNASCRQATYGKDENKIWCIVAQALLGQPSTR